MLSTSSVKPKIKNPMDWLRLILSGICMGVADIIPGISGGTIAFIMGFYEDLLNSIKSFNVKNFKLLLQGQPKLFFQNVAWEFLLGLVSGIVIAMILLAHLVGYILGHEEYRTLLYATFFGLIVAASVLCGLHLKKWNFTSVLTFILGATIAFLLTGSSFNHHDNSDLFNVQFDKQVATKDTKNYSFGTNTLIDVSKENVSAMLAKGIIKPETRLYSQHAKSYGDANSFVKPVAAKKFDGWIVLCGAIAICAMILPGISGSYLLTVLGMYAPVIGALADFTSGLSHGHFESNSFFILANMLLGITLGALLFARLVSCILNKYHDIAIALLTGFMVGALRSVWPFWSYQYFLLPLKLEKGPQLEPVSSFIPSLADPSTWLAIALALLGACLVFTLQYVAKKKIS